MTGAEARALADLLDREDIFEFVADRIVDARDKGQRVMGDRDSADVLDEVITALRRL